LIFCPLDFLLNIWHIHADDRQIEADHADFMSTFSKMLNAGVRKG
jgi:hypothetical protein